ncbi:heterokaryon incompatibility protein-domain-containing protein [Paraphoma chrysanthemicola]|uniref:Heterokaryon incompatibility protein-domain-containing protein n=1 Tax=Paraphoma chrysanthemicola TaxID=798071 RepID=A0A8K0VZD6_9PLEO|nr:heterokaryon incompatibility protein-domain-containing protein [Paraphoma chrysanthemicola]
MLYSSNRNVRLFCELNRDWTVEQTWCVDLFFASDDRDADAMGPIEILGVLNPSIEGSCIKSVDGVLLRANISEDTGSDLAVSRAKRWIETCVGEHEECRSTIPRTCPTRLLYINGLEDARLCTTSKFEAENYACLSHCWGGRPVLETTTATLQKYHDSIPWKDLPKTFQHAISFTYRLGIKYLWIDSLCILQDSAIDWQHEGSRMASIYEGAYVTLAASESPNAHAGCFRKTLDRSNSYCFQFEDSSGNDFAIYTRSVLQHHKEDTLMEVVLLQRPWTYQERLLSPRIIHFLDEELWFECRESTQCECSRRTLLDESRRKPDIRKLLQNSTSPRDLQIRWQDTIMEYSKKACNLTFPEDLFPAIQGLAKLMPQASGRYLAGHWEARLASSLLWLVTPVENSHLTKAIKWRAPSWSWASAMGWISWHPRAAVVCDADVRFTVISAKTVPKGSDPTGQSISGELVLKGTCIRGKVRCRDLDDPKIDAEYIDCTPPWSNGTRWDRPVGKHHLDGLNVILLSLHVNDDGTHTRMVLKKAHGQDDVYVRIGFFVELYEEGRSRESHLDEIHNEEQITVTIV